MTDEKPWRLANLIFEPMGMIGERGPRLMVS
jgi:hypothetical protein